MAFRAKKQRGSAFSPVNIALAKYWGKRNANLNLPTNGSISVTLKKFGSTTQVEFSERFDTDRLILNGSEEPTSRLTKARRALDALRALAGTELHAVIESENNFPTSAGLASSASGLSALTLAGAHALGLDLSKTKLSEIARLASGSACRSFFGGFVEWHRGSLEDGSDSVAQALDPVDHWPLKNFIIVVNGEKKEVASTGGMVATAKTSPFFKSWVEYAESSLADFRTAIEKKDFLRLADLSEENCLRMHATAMAASPPILYWQPKTLEVFSLVWGLRAKGVPVFFTVDAGPNVVLFCEPEMENRVRRELACLKMSILETELGPGAGGL